MQNDELWNTRTAPSGEGQGWIVGNADGTKWRTWGSVGPEWTDDREQATRYARRVDAERTHADDEDAWHIVPYSGDGRSNGAGEDRLREAAQELLDGLTSTYRARNGREVGIEADDGEKCYIVHSELVAGLRAALAQPKGGDHG